MTLPPSQVVQVVKNPPTNAGDTRNLGSIPGLGRSPGAGNGNPLQYSCLESLRDRGAWRAVVHGVRHDWARVHTTVCSLKGHMTSVWIGVPELSSLSERALSGIAGCEMFIFHTFQPQKSSWSHGRHQLWKRENGLWLSTIFSLVSVSLSSCTPLFYVDTHRNITHACRHKYTDSMHTQYDAHTHTCRHHTHMLTNTVYTHRYHTQTSHAHTWTSPLSTYTWIDLRFRLLLYTSGF